MSILESEKSSRGAVESSSARAAAEYSSSSRVAEEEETAEKAQLARYIQAYFAGILEVLENLPRPVLLLLKTNDCLRSAVRILASRLYVDATLRFVAFIPAVPYPSTQSVLPC